MAKSILVDSSIFIQLLRRRRDPAIALLERFDTLDLVTCGMVTMEVLRGVQEPAVKKALERFMSVMICVATDHRVWAEAAELAWSLDRQGRVLPSTDLLIAASAVRAGARVLTFDRHFEAIPGLMLTPVPDEWH